MVGLVRDLEYRIHTMTGRDLWTPLEAIWILAHHSSARFCDVRHRILPVRCVFGAITKMIFSVMS
jgi:hypothetical protein